MLTNEKNVLFGQWDFDKAQTIFEDYLKERADHFVYHFNAIDAIETIVGFIMIHLIEMPGKFTAMSPLFTAVIPEAIILDCVLIQLLFNVFYNEFFAQGNIMLIWI